MVEVKYVDCGFFLGDSKDRNGRWIKNGADPKIVKFINKTGPKKIHQFCHLKVRKLIV